ncbi:MAG: hypothetical protein Q4B54_13535, partial [Coriobacteriales bacterium]|nr:hypothetical protein [Coriobacteriales bacterium]
TAALTLTPLMVGCGNSNSGAGSSGTSQTEAPAAPVLDGKWRQAGHAEGEEGMIGSIDGDVIALWFHTADGDWTYWYGSLETPKDNSAYTWTSKANKANMTGLLASQDDTKDFSYADGKISFKVTIQGKTADVTMEQTSNEAGLLAELKSGEGAAPEVDAEIQDLQLVDSGYVVSPHGYVEYAIAINNPNEKYAPQSVKVNVVGRGADGTI